MRAISVLVLLLASSLPGCIDSLLEADGGEAPEADALDQEAIDVTQAIDVLSLVLAEPDTVVLVGVRALENQTVRVDSDLDVSFGGSDGPVHCLVERVSAFVDLDAFLDAGEGGAPLGEMPAWQTGSYSGGGSPTSSLGLPLSVVSMYSGGAEGGLESARDLLAGQAFLYKAGAFGVGADDMDPGSHWDLELSSDGAFEVVMLPSAPLRCGMGYGDEGAGPVGLLEDEGADSDRHVYGTTFAAFAMGGDEGGVVHVVRDDEVFDHAPGDPELSVAGPAEVRVDGSDRSGDDLWFLAGA